ncbi:hypothetical protein ACTXT7_004342 [Hymenolepis weldensis]
MHLPPTIAATSGDPVRTIQSSEQQWPTTSFLQLSLNNIFQNFIFLETQFCAYKITSQQVRSTASSIVTCLIPEIAELVYIVIKKPYTIFHGNLKLVILERIEELLLKAQSDYPQSKEKFKMGTDSVKIHLIFEAEW